MKNQTTRNKGITLIALIITIIVMLILVGVTVAVSLNGGLFETAQQAGKQTELEADKELLTGAVLGALTEDSVTVDFEKLDKNLPNGFTGKSGTYTSPNGNTFKVTKDGQIKEPSTGDLALLEKYFLGEDGQGKDLTKLVVSMESPNPEFKDDPDTPEDETELASNIHILSLGAIDGGEDEDGEYMIYQFYIEYNEKAYELGVRISVGANNFLTKTVEYKYTPTGREGQDLGTVTGDPQYNGWTILYDNGNEVEAVAPDEIGEELTLGRDDKTAQTPGDIDKDGTANTDLDRAIYSYNNAVTTINDYCKNLPGLPTNNGVRSVGAEEDPVPNLEGNNAYNEIPIEWGNSSSYNGKGKIGDTSYKQDAIRMSYYKELDIKKDYWLASRAVCARSGSVDFGVLYVNSGVTFFGDLLWSVRSGGSTSSNNPSYGVRPVIKVSI